MLEFKNKIELKDVDFAYTSNSKVLKNINLKIIKGSYIGITGLSGAGKTTLADILMGIMAVDSVKFLLDGKEVLSHLFFSLQFIKYLLLS